MLYNLDLEIIHMTNKLIIKNFNSYALLAPGIFCIWFWKLFFPDQDTTNVIKKFPNKNNLYITNCIMFFYYVLFYTMSGLSVFYKGLSIWGFPRNYPVYRVMGLIIIFFMLLLNSIRFNLIIRDYQ